jgi:hypothetical protein
MNEEEKPLEFPLGFNSELLTHNSEISIVVAPTSPLIVR